MKDYLGLFFWDEFLPTNKKEMKDSIVESVITQFKERSDVGIKKYGVILDRDDLNALEWLKHLQEELMDATLYIEKLKHELNENRER